MKKIFDDYGIEIIKNDGKFFIRYDSGEIVSKLDEIEVSQEEAQKAQISPQRIRCDYYTSK